MDGSHTSVARQKAIERGRKYRAANKELIRQRAKAYYQSHKTQCRTATRLWGSKNRDRLRAVQQRWNKAHPESLALSRAKRRDSGKITEEQRLYYLANKEKIFKKCRLWARNNPDRIKASRDKRVASGARHREHLSYYSLNKDAILQRTLKWAKQNPEKRKAIRKRAWLSNLKSSLKRRAKLKAVKLEDCSEKLKLLRIMPLCRYCFNAMEIVTIDHIVPIDRGGTHTPDNLVAACGLCNSSKGNKLLSEWNGRKAA